MVDQLPDGLEPVDDDELKGVATDPIPRDPDATRAPDTEGVVGDLPEE